MNDKIHGTILGFIVIIGAIGLMYSIVPDFRHASETILMENELLASAEGIEVLPSEFRFGIDLDAFSLMEGKIKKNQFLADILLKHGIDYPTIDRIVKEAKPIFDVRNIAAGKNYYLFFNDSNQLQFFVYEKNVVTAVVFQFGDSIAVHMHEKQTYEVEKEVFGTIESSLYEGLIKAGAPAILAISLSEIYAWTIDFYRLQKGDKFKVIFKEKYTEDGHFIAVSQIQAAQFYHYNESLYAFLYDDSLNNDYFDDNGQSLRKAFLKAPLKFGRLTSAYTNRRFHPVQKRWKAHLGTDYAAPTGTPILAVGDGVVTEAKYSKYNGNYVKVKHNGTYTTQYLHMSKFAKGVKTGSRVKQGQTIGYVGSTGLATGPHVCFRFWKNGQQVDHRKEKIPPSKPISPEKMPEYLEYIAPLKSRLGNLEMRESETPITAAVSL